MVKLSDIRNGDIVKAKTVIPFVYHYGIYMYDGRDNYLLHNTPFKSVSKTEWDDFFKKRSFVSTTESKISGIGADELNEKFNSVKDKKYNLFSYDCEDFIEEMTGNKCKTKQILTLSVILVSSLILISIVS